MSNRYTQISFMMYLITALQFIKFMGKMYAVWPLNNNTKKIWHTLYKCLWWFYFVNLIIAATITIYTCYRAHDDFTTASFSWMEFVSQMEAIVILINYKYYQNLLQNLLTEAENYIIIADVRRQSFLNERALLYALIMALITFLFFALVLLYFTNPAITSWDTYLLTAYYPLSIRVTIVDVFIYLHQIVVMCHCSVIVNMDATVVLLIYVCTVRLKILTDDFQQVTYPEKLKECIYEHQRILSLVANINLVVRLIVSKTIISFFSYTVGAGLQIINPDATMASLQRFGVVLLINYLRLILNASSADDLLTVSKNVGLSVYSTPWYEESKDIITIKIIIILRCQKLVKIYVPGIMTTLHLAYVTGIISSSISYFTTLRAITNQ